MHVHVWDIFDSGLGRLFLPFGDWGVTCLFIIALLACNSVDAICTRR